MSDVKKAVDESELMARTQLADRLDLKLAALMDRGTASVARLAVVAVSVELLNASVVAGVQAGPLQLSDLTLVRIALPVVAACLVYDFASTRLQYKQTLCFLWSLWLSYSPGLTRDDFRDALMPMQPSVMGPISVTRVRRASLTDRFIRSVSRLLSPAAMAVPVAGQVRWYAILFREFGAGNGPLLLSVCLSGLLVALAAAQSWLTYREGFLGPSSP